MGKFKSVNTPPPVRCEKCGKKIYYRWQHALRDARGMKDRGEENVRPYRSRECGHIHVGHSRKRGKP